MFMTESIYQKAWFCFSNALFQWAPPLFKGTMLIKMIYTCFCFLKKGVSLLPFNLRKLLEGFFPDNLSWHFHIIKINRIAHKTLEDAKPSVNYALQLNTYQIRINSLCFVFFSTFFPNKQEMFVSLKRGRISD